MEIAKSLFDSAVASTAVGKKIIHFSQKATVRGVEITLKVDPMLSETKISANLVKKITKNTVLVLQNGVQLIISPSGGILENGEKNTIILGQNDLKDCLISPVIVQNQAEISSSKYSEQIFNIDAKIYNLSKKLNFSSIFRPRNYESELENFLKNPYEYNPFFEYNFPSDAVFSEIGLLETDLQAEIESIKDSDPVFYAIFSEKLSELIVKKNLVLAYKAQDFEKIFENNEKLYGKIDIELLDIASKKVFEKAKTQTQDMEKLLGRVLSLEEIRAGVE